MELIDTLYSGNAWKVRLLCGYLGVPITRRTVSIVDGDLNTAEFKAINPMRQVPVLKTAEGAWLAESAAILWYLAAGTRFLPAQKASQAAIVSWLSFEQTKHMPNLSMPRLLVTLRRTATVDDPKVIAWRRAGVEALKIMEAQLETRPYMIGATPTIADVALYPYTSMAAQGGYDLAGFPYINEWLARMESLPGYTSLLTDSAMRTS